MIPSIWHLGKFSWDIALPSFILSGVKTCEILGIENVHIEGPVAVILIPGRHSTADHARINECAARFTRVIFFVYADEEGIFDSTRLDHPNKILWWAMPPFRKQVVDQPLPNGWPSEACSLIAQVGNMPRIHDVSFYGQNTHIRRNACVETMREIPNTKLLATPGFTQGVPRDEYYRVMRMSKLVACPSGPCTPDSFRFAEALEAGCIPIADDLTPDVAYPRGYWKYVLDEIELPFPIISEWATLPAVVDEYLTGWHAKAERCAIWWRAKKQSWIDKMAADVRMARS